MPWLIAILLLLTCSPLVAQDPALGEHSVRNYGFKVLERRPHSRRAWVQGLEIRDGKLYQGIGRKGQSRLQVFDLHSGELFLEKRLPGKYFGEGVTVLDERIFQLTWKARKGFIFRRYDLALLGEFPLQGQGWGLTNDGERLILSDGTDHLYFLSPKDGRILHSQRVRDRGKPVTYLNELEWTPDYLLANVWYSNKIMMIDPRSGDVIGRIDLSGLLPDSERRSDTSVLNGIARDPETGDLWVTGKNWPWLYRIELLEESEVE